MRFLVTADLHYNHGRSKVLAEEVIDRMNAAGSDGVLVIGDTATSEGDALEQCLSRFTCTGPKLFVAGNHELWTSGEDSHRLIVEELPRRVRALGWHWLQGEPYCVGRTAIVGNVGWYDYSFAQDELGIPRRFYENHISPGAAENRDAFVHLVKDARDIGPVGREVYARWNDGQFVKLGRSDEQFLDELMTELDEQLVHLSQMKRVIVAVHHLPFEELLPPPRRPQWDFAKAFLGSRRIGEMLLRYSNVEEVWCGHSHFACQARVERIRAKNIGCGYRWKTFEVLEVG